MAYYSRRTVVIIASIVVMIVGALVALVSAQEATPTPSDYVELQFTDIRGLSVEEIEGYQTGAGLGYALPAELNGYPGPRHVLDLAAELDLTDEQDDAIQELYDTMLPQAIELGEDILAQEEAIELAFREGSMTDDQLKETLVEAARLEGDLRYVHLSTHLATIDILSPRQVHQYNQLRGYEAPSHEEHSGH